MPSHPHPMGFASESINHDTPIYTQQAAGLAISQSQPIQYPWSAGHLMVDGSGQNLQCPCCGKRLESRYALQRHISAFHPEALPFSCNICGKGMHTKRGLELHEITHGERKFICSICKSKFKFKHHLKGHLFNIHNVKLCPNCSGLFNSSEFNGHLLTCV
ncbi:Zinc finger protein 652 [Plakobranchus ocellatus]|uniref:Zinc finger protein 652 n=1 Tax=Plakobranchus ocellatus TaxID=259542 RepID=A0AAV3YCF8_9GAST|nr:Zinc finger protein 652 [Plakobranchus ocellatus]